MVFLVYIGVCAGATDLSVQILQLDKEFSHQITCDSPAVRRAAVLQTLVISWQHLWPVCCPLSVSLFLHVSSCPPVCLSVHLSARLAICLFLRLPMSFSTYSVKDTNICCVSDADGVLNSSSSKTLF